MCFHTCVVCPSGGGAVMRLRFQDVRTTHSLSNKLLPGQREARQASEYLSF